MYIELWDPSSPGVRRWVKRNWWQRLLYPKNFATLGEVIKHSRRLHN